MTGIGEAAVVEALATVEERVRTSLDWDYWRYHRKRYEYSARSISRAFPGKRPEDVRILDVGSHYLHLSSVLAELGFAVVGMDVEEFADDPLVKTRAAEAGIPNHLMGSLETGDFSLGEGDDFDLILFTETLEHLAFNPKEMWLGLFSLLRPGGRVYVTTPNGLSLRKLPLHLAGLCFRSGYGPSIKQVLGKPTLAIHWKEYSAREMKRYFPMLGIDAALTISFYRYKPLLRSCSLVDWGGALCNFFAELVPPLREEMEVWIDASALRTSSQ